MTPTAARATARHAAPPLVAVQDLAIAFDGHEVVHDVSFTLRPGQCVGIVGESGSGKSVTARALLGLNGPGAQVSATTLDVGVDVLTASEQALREVRGRRLGYVLQDALVSLDPLRRVGTEIAEPLRVHGVPRAERPQRVQELLASVSVPEPALRARQLPSELSGGLRQRALIAAALALDPQVLIADEPTTALDVTVQAQILELLQQNLAAGRALILISHDLSVVERLADHVLVMHHGRVVEEGPTSQVLAAPQDPYTRRLLAAIPSAGSRGRRLSDLPPAPISLSPRAERARADGTTGADELARPEGGTGADAARRPVGREQADGPGPATSRPVLVAEGLSKSYRGPDGRLRRVVEDVSFQLCAGETLGIVGESGSGKSTAAAMALALTEPTAGHVTLDGEPWTGIPERRRRPRRRRIAVVQQDPLSSFDPRWTVGRTLADALPSVRRERGTGPARDGSGGDRTARIAALLRAVGLDPALAHRHPLTLSGGQRQRVAIARALATDPEVLVLDEPVSALDVSVQAQVLDLLADLQQALGTAHLFISHDLGVIHHVSDRVLVMQHGRVVESGTADEVLHTPRHPYTRQLVAALPHPELEEIA
ncbi:dipeptide ABC transporter ATP-binding protein [Brachybacterium saurashtrense]|uniref:ABC transporter ATP-binding protein n=1 Tax=Brachybacterium saurashtrense TaxID=556288 RepID=A0A345YR08_9MICO|nr:ABC transporter ATP-binding protein [Brachybacterium saurashtrense]AXK46360.1 ABC transporter ATP-binding protein [Brachybacterium saurashtrense]RRR24100.1 ABC transporter ATP-binding protein [Brachybacterium saurashtrense]